ncbi:hypothetical protein [Hymenobacter sp. BT730]|uniref:hypothetical protein n=1 Tax=Hymenobacter sp. BT730 TaxID=3063332 RepID=UPI0026DEC0FF|nr:hypothetical protein [Hymenobacter sp. BT730]
MFFTLRPALLPFAKISLVICSSLSGIGCQPTAGDQESAGLESHDTIQVTKFDITRTRSLPTKEWQVFYADEDLICLPIEWRYQETDSVFFVATGSQPRTDERIEIIRYGRADVPQPHDAVAKGRYQLVLQESDVIESEGLVKEVFDQHTLYEAHLVTQHAGLTYDDCLMLYVNETYVYQIKIRLRKPETQAATNPRMEDIVHNLQFNHKYLFDNLNPMQQAVIIEPKYQRGH